MEKATHTSKSSRHCMRVDVYYILIVFLCFYRGPEYSLFVGDLTPDVTDTMLQVSKYIRLVNTKFA